MTYIQRFSCPCRSAPQTATFSKHGQSPGLPIHVGVASAVRGRSAYSLLLGARSMGVSTS